MRFALLIVLTFCLFLLSSPSYSQDLPTAQTSTAPLSNDDASVTDENQTDKAYISDDLFIFMRSGAGKQYRLLGSITAGSAITLIDETTNGFQKITDDKGRSGWIEEKYISKNPSLRNVIAELNTQLADKDEIIKNLKTDFLDEKQQITVVNTDNAKLKTQIKSLTKQLAISEMQAKKQDTGMQKQWFFNGAIVLGIGLFLGLLLPKLFTRRRNAMENWQ